MKANTSESVKRDGIPSNPLFLSPLLRPLGRAMKDEKLRLPGPVVRRPRLVRHGGVDPGLKSGRGFSLAELEEAGLTLGEAKALGIRIDKRRKNKHPWNVEALKRFVEELGLKMSEEGS